MHVFLPVVLIMLLGVAVAAAKMFGVLLDEGMALLVGVPTVFTAKLPGGGFFTGTTTLLQTSTFPRIAIHQYIWTGFSINCGHRCPNVKEHFRFKYPRNNCRSEHLFYRRTMLDEQQLVHLTKAKHEEHQ